MSEQPLYTIEVTVGSLSEPMRLDRYVAEHHSGVPRSVFSYPETEITCNGKVAKKSLKVSSGDRLVISYRSREPLPLVGQKIPLEILYEDTEVLIVDKRAGMVVHPGVGNWSDTLVNALLGRYGMEFASRFEQSDRPGIVHRLDKETSGVLAVAKQQTAAESLSAQFKARSVERIYIAAVQGEVSRPEGSITTHLKRHPKDRTLVTVCSSEEGRDARTDYQVVGRGQGWTLLRIALFTGRTHQIRVHLRSIGHPVLGDSIYGKKASYPMLLHALRLGFDHPKSGQRITAVAKLPERFIQLLARRSSF